MARYNTVKIGTEYLTSNGLVGGLPCKVSIPELDRLQLPYGGSTVIALSGKPYTFIEDALGIGEFLTITQTRMTQAVYNNVRAILQNALATETTINVTIVGDFGSFDFQCMPRFTDNLDPIQFPGEFRNGIVNEISFRLVIESVNPGA